MIFHSAWLKSRMKHKEPIMGSLHTPYRETGMRGFEPLPVVGFLFPTTLKHGGFFFFMNENKNKYFGNKELHWGKKQKEEPNTKKASSLRVIGYSILGFFSIIFVIGIFSSCCFIFIEFCFHISYNFSDNNDY